MKQSKKIYKDFMVTGEFFTLKKVENVPGLLQTTPTPAIEALSKYYESDEYLSHSAGANNLFSWIYFQVKRYNLRKKFNLITKNKKSPKVLDYGCGVGELVSYCRKKGIDAYGYEPNEDAYKLANVKNSSSIYQYNDFLNKEKYDVITLWHVLEHIPNIDEILSKLIHALSDDGEILIAVPNYKSYDAQYYKEFWAAYDVPRHLWHFDQGSMMHIMNDLGMIIESKRPMLFDAFYVSMLSEKYKGSSFGFIQGLLIGFISNLKALKTTEFSSMIYRLRRK